MTANTFQDSANTYRGALAKRRDTGNGTAVYVMTTGPSLKTLRRSAKNHDMVFASKTMDFDDGALYRFVPK